MDGPLKMSGGRKIWSIANCESPYEISRYFNHFGRRCIRSPLEQKHIIDMMLECRYTMKSMSDTTGISTSLLGKWKKRWCPKNKGVVYVLLDRRQSAFKVGLTRRSVEARVKDLQTSLAGDLEIFLAIKALDPEKVEGELHSFLKGRGKHLKREWFDLDRETTAYLRIFREELQWEGLHDPTCEYKHERMWDGIPSAAPAYFT